MVSRWTPRVCVGKDMPARPRARAREQLGLGLYRSQLAFSPSRPTLRAAGRQLGLADRRAHLMVEVPPLQLWNPWERPGVVQGGLLAHQDFALAQKLGFGRCATCGAPLSSGDSPPDRTYSWRNPVIFAPFVRCARWGPNPSSTLIRPSCAHEISTLRISRVRRSGRPTTPILKGMMNTFQEPYRWLRESTNSSNRNA